MNKPFGFRGSSIAAAIALALPALAFGGPRDIDRLVLDQLSKQGRADIFVKMASDASLDAAESLGSKAARGQYVYDTLNAHANLTQQGVRRMLDQRAGFGALGALGVVDHVVAEAEVLDGGRCARRDHEVALVPRAAQLFGQ